MNFESAHKKISDSINDCRINNLSLNKNTNKIFTFENNSINNLIIENDKVYLNNIKLNLYHHKNIDRADLKFDNVEIEYNGRILKQIDKKMFRGYWNTFNKLLTINGLNSERLQIEKYISYFDSRQNWFKKLLFKFNGGYTKWIGPAFFTILFAAINYCILFFELHQTEKALVMVVYPLDLYKDVIFRNFDFQQSFSFWKFIVFFVEILLIYSFVSFGIAVRKILGFRIFRQ